MRSNLRNGIALVIASIGTTLPGCTVMVHDIVLPSYPTFEVTERSWPTLEQNEGRVVIYWPRSWGGMDTVQVTVDGDATKPGRVGHQTFVFVDSGAGSHTIEFIHAGPFFTSQKQASAVDVRAGEMVFLMIGKTFASDAPPKPVDEAQAREALKTIHHNYKAALPFNRQPKDALPAL
jgi:hypothetical protein